MRYAALITVWLVWAGLGAMLFVLPLVNPDAQAGTWPVAWIIMGMVLMGMTRDALQ